MTQLTKSRPANPAPIPATFAWGVLFTCLAWCTLWIAFVIVALHAESLRDIRSARLAIWIVAGVMLLAGIVGGIVATHELCRSQPRIIRWLATALWTMAFTIGIGSFIRRPHDWPGPEIICGLVLAIAVRISFAIANRSHKSKSGSREVETI
jgi:uncharacterized membrane-anchored protein